jgi:mercuric ion transport protein
MDRNIDTLGWSAGTAHTTGRQRLAVVGGMLGALAASSCCILPLVLFSFGAGGRGSAI